MATVNLGSIKFKWKGTYSGATAYTVDDVVEYNGSSYICILASTGNLPTNATYFEQMSSAGTNGTNGTDVGTVITTQGDLLYRDGSGLQRLGIGTAGQALKVNSGATGYEFGSAGGLKQIKQVIYNGTDSISSTTYVVVPNFNLTITPTASDSSFLIMATIQAGHSNNDTQSGWNFFDSQVGTTNGDQLFAEGQVVGSRSRVFQSGKFGLNAIGSVNNFLNFQTNISIMYTPVSNNSSARTFYVCQKNPSTTTYMNYNTDDSAAGFSSVSNMIIMEIANGIYI
jgi:hypothetical protein